MVTPFSSRVPALRVRIGTLVWIAVGVAVLASAVRSHLPRPSVASAAAAAVPVQALQGASIPNDSAVAYQPSGELRTGGEIVMIFIGASFCGADRQPGFPESIERAKLLVQRQANGSGRGFRAVAVSLDWDPDTALAFLKPFGRWDELSVGGNWANDAALRYLWGGTSAVSTVPQVLLLERQMEVDEAVRVTGTREVRRLIGAPQISRWIQDGASI